MSIEQRCFTSSKYAEMLALIGNLLRQQVQFSIAYRGAETLVAFPANALRAAKSESPSAA